MAGRKYTPEQIIGILHQVEVAVSSGRSTPQACRRLLGQWRGTQRYLATQPADAPVFMKLASSPEYCPREGGYGTLASAVRLASPLHSGFSLNSAVGVISPGESLL
jgi:hypothetical protein